MERSTDDLIADLLRAADVAAEIAGLGRERWGASPMAQFAAENVIIRAGEVTNRLPEDVRDAMPDVPWHSIKGARNRVAHEYHDLDPETLWVTVTEKLPELVAAIVEWQARSRDGRVVG